MIDYLVVGHVTQDLMPTGPVVGGTAAYAARTARALGCRVGVVTSAHPGLELSAALLGSAIHCLPADTTTTFENLYTDAGRRQVVRSVAGRLDLSAVPQAWRRAPIAHLAPLIQEVDPSLVGAFPLSLVGVTPQGWLRRLDARGAVSPCAWESAETVLRRATAVVLSVEDVGGDEGLLATYARWAHILAVTRGRDGSTVTWAGETRHFPAPGVEEIDPTGAGDVYAAAFFCRLYETRDPWEAARFATCLAALSVMRAGLAGTPTVDDVTVCRKRTKDE
jgi:hypothetical protein